MVTKQYIRIVTKKKTKAKTNHLVVHYHPIVHFVNQFYQSQEQDINMEDHS